MALFISPQHDALVHSPRGRFAVLPDLPYGGFPPRADGSSHSQASRLSPQAPLSASAPTSPLNRPHYPAVSPMTSISPISLPQSIPNGQVTIQSRPAQLQQYPKQQSYPAGPSRPPVLHVTPQQMAKHQAAQAISQGQSYFPPVPRVSPPTTNPAILPNVHSNSGVSNAGNPIMHRAPLSSTNLASLSRATSSSDSTASRQNGRKGRTRAAELSDDAGSGSETEKGGGSDSDATVVDFRRAGKASYSQTDIPALRRRLTSAWQAQNEGLDHGETSTSGAVSQVTGNGVNGKIRDTDTITLPRPPQPLGRKTPPKTPPSRPMALQSHTQPVIGTSQPISPGKSPGSRSTASLASLRRSPTTSPRASTHALRRSPTTSPRGSSHNLAPLTPFTSATMSPKARAFLDGAGEAASSDADAEDGSHTDDSSVSFGTKRHGGLRRRSLAPTNPGSTAGLGLSLGGGQDQVVDLAKTTDDLIPDAIERLYRSSSLLYLRILAIMPACWGTLVLLHGLAFGQIRHDVWPWGVDLSREALYHLSQGGGAYEGVWRRAIRGDLLLCIAWAILTGHFCFRFTTGLTYRWRSYYDLLPVLVRLLALQALCWPATYITLAYLGPSQPLFAWAVIGVSTGITYAVIMWLASNVLPDPEDERHSRSRSRPETDGDKTPPAGSRSNSTSTPSAAKRAKSTSSSSSRPSVFPEWGEALLISPPVPPVHLSWWAKLNYKRRWDWDSVAHEVGWKVGGLLLLTSAWVFWQIHIGWYVRPDHLGV